MGLRSRGYANMSSNGDAPAAMKPKLHGRAFYESIGSPKFVVAPMVDQSEFVRSLPRLLAERHVRRKLRRR